MATMSINGVVSGMDWESMIDELVTKAAKPAQVQVSKKTNLTNKKSLFEEMKVMVNSIKSSMTSLKLPSTYKAKEIDIENISGTGSYKGILTATVNADAEVNVWNVKVNQLATAQINRSKQITGSNLTSTLNGVKGSTMYVSAAGQKIGIEVNSSDTLQSLKSKINTTLKTLDNPIHVTASVVDNRLILKSDNTGIGTYTATETIKYGGNGTNTLQNMSVKNPTADTFKITASGKTYTYGTDFTVANGNEIRWKQYDRSNEVAIGDTANVKYTMGKDDVYTNEGKYGDSEAVIKGFDLIKNGTLSERLKITDEDGNTYTYGKDFTIDESTKKVKWLEDTTPTTREPSSYTVSYEKITPESYNVSGNKVSAVTTPSSFSVQYTDDLVTSTGLTYGRHDGSYSFINITSGSLTTFSDMTALDGVSSVSDGTYDYLTFQDDSEMSININGTDYVYGRDYVIRKGQSSEEMFFVPYRNGASDITRYLTAAGKTIPDGVQISPQADITAERAGTISYSHTTTIASTNQTAISDLLSNSSTDTSKITIFKADGSEYTADTDYSIVDGEIKWKLPNDTTDITMSQFAELQTKYAAATKDKTGTASELSTITRIDGNGILRTYVDPDDTSIFTMSAGGQDYEYGRDYVIRVNDAGTGYRFEWLIEGDSNNDGNTDIRDASTVVATYAAYKNINTQEWKAAPAENTAYTFGFSYNNTETASGSVSSSSTDKSLSSILSGATVDSADYASTLKITDSNGNEYTYGVDWTVNSSGDIEWIPQSYGKPSAYSVTLPYTINKVKITSNDYNLTSEFGFPNYTQLQSIYSSLNNGATLPTVTSPATGYTYIDDASVLSIDGLTYGRDYVLRLSVDNSSIAISFAGDGSTIYNAVGRYAELKGIDTTGFKSPAVGELVQGVYKGSVKKTAALNTTNEDSALSSLLGTAVSANDYANLVVSDGTTTYKYGTDYTIESGKINWLIDEDANKPKRPAEGASYTLTYEAADPFEATGTVSSDSTQTVEIAAAEGFGEIDDDKLSYEQILSLGSLTSSSIDSDFAKYFTLTDGTTTYTYGTDYRIKQGDADSTSGKHKTVIEWISGGTKPAAGTSFTLEFTGGTGEELTTDGVTRSATDTINAIDSEYPTASDFEDGTNTITYAGRTYYEGEDFNITSDSDGNATITWISDKNGGSEWYYPSSGSYYTINHTDEDGNVTSYNASRNGSTTLDMSEYGMTTANGTISVQYGDALAYRLDAPADVDENGNTVANTDGHAAIRAQYSIDITEGSNGSYTFNWATPTLTSRTGLPSYGEELTVEYEYDANTFDLSDDSDGDLLKALGFLDDKGEYADYIAAQDAELEVDGEKVYRASNDIGADYDNELIKGVTLHLKGLGEVSLDISQDAQKAVESIQTFIENYNDLMTWMNTRMTEKELDEDAKATVDSDDFKMRWGLLHGNSLLRNTKSKMRDIMAQNYTFSFTQRKSSEEIYGTMAHNGLRSSSTLRLRIGTTYVDVTIDPTDTIKDIVDKINDDTKNGPMNNIYYDENGNKRDQPLLRAEVQDDQLVINSTTSDEITMSGSAAMNALKMNYTYRGLYQLGIATTSTDYGKSGELEFDTNKFMEALEDNADEVQTLMLKFAGEMDSWLTSMTTSSASGETSGTLTRQIEDLDTQINSINDYLKTYQDRLDRMEERLRTQYANAEQNFAKLSQQANSIASILQMMAGNSSNSSSSSS